MSDFSKFMTINGLKRKDIASFLGVSGAFVTQLTSGERRLPPEKLALIKANPFGWDVSMLTVASQSPMSAKATPAIRFVVGAEAEDARIREGYIKRLLEEIKELKAQRDALIQEVAVLKYQLEQK